jgi:hypothetical protein
MPVEKVQLGVSVIKGLLDNGYTWLKKDDLGFGSVQEKYQASDVQIATIRKHPLLKDLETTARVFVIIDDTKDNDTTLEAKGPAVERTSNTSHGSTVPVVAEPATVETDTDSFSAFANL